MSAPTLPPAQLAADLHSALASLRIARTVGDTAGAVIAEQRLNHLLEHIHADA